MNTDTFESLSQKVRRIITQLGEGRSEDEHKQLINDELAPLKRDILALWNRLDDERVEGIRHIDTFAELVRKVRSQDLKERAPKSHDERMKWAGWWSDEYECSLSLCRFLQRYDAILTAKPVAESAPPESTTHSSTSDPAIEINADEVKYVPRKSIVKKGGSMSERNLRRRIASGEIGALSDPFKRSAHFVALWSGKTGPERLLSHAELVKLRPNAPIRPIKANLGQDRPETP